MKKTNVLYISGSIGLGHVTRDLAIARQLREQLPDIAIDWLAAHPATLVLEEAGETLVAGCDRYANESASAEEAARGTKLSLLTYLMKARGAWKRNIELFAKLVTSKQYDLVIGDETYEITLALRKRPELKTFPFVMIFDFVGLEAMSGSPLERLGVYFWNRVWSHDYRKKRSPPYDLGVFVGELQDVPDTSFGFMLPNRRQFAATMYKFVGYVFPFDPSALEDRATLRRELGYGPEPLIIASVGGTSIGRELLELCGDAYAVLREKVPSVHLVLVAGPRVAPGALRVPAGVEVRLFVPDLYRHFAACDLAIVQGGATSTLELTALKRPFLYFPLDGHSEQAGVARILTRRGAGVQMRYAESTPASLAEKMVGMLGCQVSSPGIPADGAQKAARLIGDLLARSGP